MMFEVVCEFVNDESALQLCPDWVLLATIAITLTVATASPERGFSLLKLIKTRLRSSLSQPMLDALMRINWLLDEITTPEMLLQFAYKWISKGPRRADFGIGKVDAATKP